MLRQNTHKSIVLLLVFLPAIFFVNGCGYLFGDNGLFPDKSADYLKSEESPPLKLPASSSLEAAADNYPIPELKYAKVLPKKYVVPRVDSLENLESKGSVKVQSFKDDQWVLLRRSPSQAWPLVLQFLESNQVVLNKVLPEKGLIETDWLNVEEAEVLKAVDRIKSRKSGRKSLGKANETNGLPLERYQFLLKQGIQKNTTEVWVKHSITEGALSDSQIWGKSNSHARQENMINLVAEHLAGTPDQVSHSLLAQGIGSASKVSLEYSQAGEPYLDLKLPFDRGWASLQLALKKASFEINDLDREQGVYYARFIDKQKKKKKPGYIKRAYRYLRPRPKNTQDNMLVKAQQHNESLHITIARQTSPALESNEQAYMLRRILNKLG